MIRKMFALILSLLLVLSLAACGGDSDGNGDSGDGGSSAEGTDTGGGGDSKGPITVGSKIDTEGELLGTMIVQTLEANGFEVVNKVKTGQTDIVRNALTSGEIDVYPEYTGSALIFFEGDPLATVDDFKDAEQGYEIAKELDAENGIAWLEPARANNTWALATKADFAEAEGLETMSDFAEYVNAGKEVKLAGSDEFFNNVDAMPAFQEAYGFQLQPNQKVVLSGGDTAQTEKAAADNTDGVNFAMAYGTDGAISELGLTVLDDDKGAQLVYWPTPTVRQEVLDEYPEIADLLKPVFEGLTLEKLQELNGRIQVNGEPADTVASDYLAEVGVLD